MKLIFTMVLIMIGCSGAAIESPQYQYQLVKLIKLDNKNFNHTAEDGYVYTEIAYPGCEQTGTAEIDVGDYYLGPDCFYGNIQYIEIIKKESGWRLQIPICYAGHTFNFARTIKIFCRYPADRMCKS